MPRKPRFNLLGIPQHIIQRGNNCSPCFLSEEDYQRYLSDLKMASEKYGCKIHAFVLMTNHVHLLATPLQENGLSQLMQALGRRYVRYINHQYHRSGTLWEGRFKSSLVDSDAYLLICMRYIELNPVRAAMVDHPGDYQWSSYQANAHSQNIELVEHHPIYLNLGQTSQEREHHYHELFRHHIDADTVHQIRKALNHELVLGRSYFKDTIKEMTQRATRLGKPGRPKVEEEQAEYWVV